MSSDHPCLILGGAPRLAIDAVRYLTVRATGATAVALERLLAARGITAHLLLSEGAEPAAQALRYADRDSLEHQLGRWIARHPMGTVVMSAAVNDYRVAAVESTEMGETRRVPPGTKIPSGADEVVIRLRPASKLIDRLRGEFGLRGAIVGFKYEDRTTVVTSATALRARTGAAVVVANSLCGNLQALVDADGVSEFADRSTLLTELADRIAGL
jgi:phosphopantothenate-cysteine ligase/phosphopantothenoylcysteine decarboxylase/phosphopantothenate--cysteine ligase